MVANQPGKATLHVGEASLSLEIVPSDLNRSRQPKLTILTPVSGAYVNGSITVGVEVELPEARSPEVKPKLVLSDRKEILPRGETTGSTGNARVYSFAVNVAELPVGPIKLQVVSSANPKIASSPVYVTSFSPQPSQVISGNCVDHVDGKQPPAEYKKPFVVSKDDKDAPAGCLSDVEAWCYNTSIAKAGYYQMILRARGIPALGSFPMVGLYVDRDGGSDNRELFDMRDYPTTFTQLCDRSWCRIACGAPVYLTTGPHVLDLVFLNNDGYAESGRKLSLDRFELAEVPLVASAPVGKEVAGNASSMTMMNAASTMTMAGKAMVSHGSTGSAGPSYYTNYLRLAFTKVFNHYVVNGPITLSAECDCGNQEKAPVVDLLLNGKTFASQTGYQLTFHIPPGALVAGENSLQLRTPGKEGGPVFSAIQTVVYGGETQQNSSYVRYFRFTALDKAWDPEISKDLITDYLSPGNNTSRLNDAVVPANGDVILNLPDDMEGTFNLNLEGLPNLELVGSSIVKSFLVTGPQNIPIGSTTFLNDETYQSYPLGPVTLPAGPKHLVFHTATGWRMKAISLEEVIPPSKIPPTIEVLYPTKSSNPVPIGGTDVLVARAFSADGLDKVELLVDGQPQPYALGGEDGLGRFLLPVLTRGLAAGAHQAQVRAQSKDGQETLSPIIPFTLVDNLPADQQPFARAVHLLNRFGYGPEPEELADILVMGETPWLKDRLTRSFEDSGEQAASDFAQLRFCSEDSFKEPIRTLDYLLKCPNPAPHPIRALGGKPFLHLADQG